MDLRAQRKAAIQAAKAITDTALKEKRELTDEEQTEIEAKMAEVADLDARIKGQDLVKSIMALGGSADNADDDGDPAPPRSLGEHFAKSVGREGFLNLKSRSGYTVSTPEFKANTDPHDVGSVFSDALTQVDTSVVRSYRRPLVVADLLSSGSLSGAHITYMVEGAAEGNFAAVAELGQKPQIHIADPTTVTDSLKKIAAWWDTSDEMVEDLPFMVSEINNRALYMLSLVEESQLLSGDGTGSNLLGLLNRSGIQTETSAAGGGDDADALFRAATKVQTATGLAADGIVINPTDYQRLRLARDGNDQYYGGGYFTGPYGNGGIIEQPPLWGLRTVVSASVSAGTAVVGAFRAAGTVYRKGGVRVESTNSDAGKFTSNIITTRVEERIALAVRIPSAVVEVTFTA